MPDEYQISASARSELSAFLTVLRSDRLTVLVTVAGLLFCLVLIAGYSFAVLSYDLFEVSKSVIWIIALNRDGGFAEIVGYAASAISVLCFGRVYLRRGGRVSLFLMTLMMYIGVDDAFKYHERFGAFLVEGLNLGAVGGLRAQDTGEIAAWSIAALTLACIIVWSRRRIQPGDQGVAMLVGLLFVALVLCGVVLDMLHIVLPGQIGFVIGVLEDGGELMCLVAIACTAFGFARNYDQYRRVLYAERR